MSDQRWAKQAASALFGVARARRSETRAEIEAYASDRDDESDEEDSFSSFQNPLQNRVKINSNNNNSNLHSRVGQDKIPKKKHHISAATTKTATPKSVMQRDRAMFDGETSEPGKKSYKTFGERDFGRFGGSGAATLGDRKSDNTFEERDFGRYSGGAAAVNNNRKSGGGGANKKKAQYNFELPARVSGGGEILDKKSERAGAPPSNVGGRGKEFVEKESEDEIAWETHTTEGGNTFYYNPATNESLWVKPDELQD